MDTIPAEHVAKLAFPPLNRYHTWIYINLHARGGVAANIRELALWVGLNDKSIPGRRFEKPLRELQRAGLIVVPRRKGFSKQLDWHSPIMIIKS